MSVLRTLGNVFGGLIFIVFFIASIAVTSLVQLLQHDNLKEIALDLVRTQLPQADAQSLATSVAEQCKTKESIQVPFDKGSFGINCAELKNKTSGELTTAVVSQVFDEIYFMKYDCDFIACLQQPAQEKFLILFSSTAYKFFGNLQFALWAGTILGAVILFVSIGTWTGRLKRFGVVLIFVGVTFFALNAIRSLVLTRLPTAIVNVSPIIEKVFGLMATNYLIVFIAGIALLAVGYSISIFGKRGTRNV